MAGILTGFRSPLLTPGAVMFGAAAAWRGTLLLRPVQVCSYRSMLAYWCVGLLLHISDARSCAHCRCLRHCVRLRWCLGVRGYHDVRAVGLQGGNSRPPWKLPPGAAASMVFGSCSITLQTLTQMRRRHGAARNFKELWSWGHGDAEVIGPMQIRLGSHFVGSVVLWSVCGRWADLHICPSRNSFKSF